MITDKLWDYQRIRQALSDASSDDEEIWIPIDAACAVAIQIRDDMQARIATLASDFELAMNRVKWLEREVNRLEGKAETTRECAEIIGRQLEEARGLLAANGIYEDEGGADNGE